MNKSSNKIGYWQLKDKHVSAHPHSKFVCIGSFMTGFLTVGPMGGGGRGWYILCYNFLIRPICIQKATTLDVIMSGSTVN